MKRRSACIALALLLTGCAFGAYQTWADFRNRNSAALANLRIGMTMEQVQQTMGTIAVTGCSIHYQLLFCLASETTTNPAYTASIVGADGKSYVAWMYYTSYCTDNKPKSDCHTPVVFQD